MKKANNMKMIDKSELEKQVQLEESIDESKQSFNVSIHSKRQKIRKKKKKSDNVKVEPLMSGH